MSKRGGQKGKMLLLLQYLERESDEEHPVPTKRLLSMLEENGVTAERKSVYDDLDVLAQLGYDIGRKPGAQGGVYLGQRPFEVAELKLLVDAVQASRFITRRKSDALIAKLENLASRYQAGQLQRQVYVGGRVKSMNESVYYSIDAIHAAIAAKRQVSFRYFDFNSRKERVFRREGATYYVIPYCLAWDNANYYLVGREPRESQTRHYRVDKMAGVAVTDIPGVPPEDFHPAEYVNRYFSMFSGESAKVRLFCPEKLAGVILDRFGQEVMLVPQEGGFTVTLDVVVSPQFWGWLAGLGPEARLLSPDWAVEEYQSYLKNLIK